MITRQYGRAIRDSSMIHHQGAIGNGGILRSWFARVSGRQFLSWARQQLNIQPYQHLLEIGYGAGLLTEEVSRALRIGFIAGIESSIPLYQQAYKRNKRFVHQQLLQLHIGQSYELPYPPFYFHTVYGVNLHLSGKDIGTELFRLVSLLKNKGRLVLLLEAGHSKEDINQAVARLRVEYQLAGLTSIHIEHPPFPPSNAVAIIGIKA